MVQSVQAIANTSGAKDSQPGRQRALGGLLAPGLIYILGVFIASLMIMFSYSFFLVYRLTNRICV